MNHNDAMGSRRSHYSPAKDGPFRCKECIHFTFPHLCDHPEVILDAKDKLSGLRISQSGNLAIVEPGGCCEYERKA